MFTVLGLGSNKSFASFDSIQLLSRACDLLEPFFSDFTFSSVYRTKPMYVTDQDDFYTICISFDTDLKPLELLDLSQSIEAELHRVRTIKNGPRTIDLDILLYGDEKIKSKRLIVPHERMFERAFVLIPLSELKDIDVPIPTDKSVKKLRKFTF